MREGAEAVVCASTGNTAASLAAYAARAGIRGVVIVPEGKIAMGKLAQALMHGAQVIAIQGNFDRALLLVRELADKHPIALVNSVNEFRIEGQKTAAYEIAEAAGPANSTRSAHSRVGNAGNITAYWRGFNELLPAATDVRLPSCRQGAPLVLGKPVEQPETIAKRDQGIGNPARWEQAMDSMTSSGGAVNAVSDEQILEAYRFLAREEKGSASRVVSFRRGADRARRRRRRSGSPACSPVTG